MVRSKHALPGEAHIHTGSYLCVGGDDDAASQVISFRYRAARRTTKGGNRPRVVVRKPGVEGELSQTKLTELARTCTKPIPGAAYVDPQEVKVFFQVARRTRLPEDWKRGLRGRKTARQASRKSLMPLRVTGALTGLWQRKE